MKSGIVTHESHLHSIVRVTIFLSGDNKVLCTLVTQIAIFYKSSMVYRTADFKTKLSYKTARKVNAMPFTAHFIFKFNFTYSFDTDVEHVRVGKTTTSQSSRPDLWKVISNV